MYPDPKGNSPNNREVKIGTEIYIPGFKSFIVESDSTVHIILLNFTRKIYPKTKDTEDSIILACFYDMESGPKKMSFGHTLYY